MQNVLFKYSNTREAIFDDEQSSFFQGNLEDKIILNNPLQGGAT